MTHFHPAADQFKLGQVKRMGSSSKICVNSSCGTTSCHEWKRGWPLRSGGYADLCSPCGSAYETSVFCDKFHSEEAGWRECNICGKHLHCGCIVSQFLLQLLDFGGVGCTNCAKGSQHLPRQNDDILNGYSSLMVNGTSAHKSTPIENRLAGGSIDEGKLAQLCGVMDANEPNLLSESNGTNTKACPGQFQLVDVVHQVGELNNGFVSSVGSSKYPNLDSIRSMLDMRQMPSLSMTAGTPSGTTNLLPFSCGSTDGRDKSKTPFPFEQCPRSRPILPKPSKHGLALGSDSVRGMAPVVRLARPPVEGRGKSQLLPRYWPRITNQELQQLAGDLNSEIVPLFEKVLSSSDAGRIGRLVLPKACAEAYFPPISQSDGIPLRIQDVKGGEWTFQFRFWPNNNSRMYVLEGVTPCLQSLQLQAGDTIMFSRVDPGGKLMIGYRKATDTSVDTQDAQSSAPINVAASRETSFSVAAREWNKGENNRSDDPMQQLIVAVEKKRTHNIGPKNKRLFLHSEDAMERRLTWEEAQDLLRPPPSVKPTIVNVEDHEFEEYEEPPVFGKKTIFTARAPAGQDQWAQCDNCMKWRKLPVDALLSPKWTCPDNIWDSSRCTCSAPEEISSKDVYNLHRVKKDFKQRRIAANRQQSIECEPSGLDALASAAVLGDDAIGNNSGSDQPIGATTKHPRHRPGCSCIVCIQPPSGKGKHKPTCTCNVCLTVKRRFKTLMLRKKKRQSEHEALPINGLLNETTINDMKDELERNGASNNSDNTTRLHHVTSLEKEGNESISGQIDLNFDPRRNDMQVDLTDPSIDNNAKQNGNSGMDLGSCSLSQSNGNGLRRLSDEAFLASMGWDSETQHG